MRTSLRDAIAGGGARPVVEWQLEVAEAADLVAILRRAHRDAARLIIHDPDAAGALVAVEPIDEADECPPFQVQIGGDLAAEHLKRRLALLHEQPVDVALRRALRAAHLELELHGRLEAVAVTFERPGYALAHAAAHRRLVACRRAWEIGVKILEREVQRGAVCGRRRTGILDRRAGVPVEPLARALGICVERRRAEVPLPRLDAGWGLGRERLRELDLATVANAAVLGTRRDRCDRRQLERLRDQRAQALGFDILRHSANAARALGESQHVVALGRRQREPSAVDRVEQRPGAPCERRIRGGDVVTHAGMRRTNETEQGFLSAGAMPPDGIGDEGTEQRGLGRRHDLKLQVPPGAPAANV